MFDAFFLSGLVVTEHCQCQCQCQLMNVTIFLQDRSVHKSFILSLFVDTKLLGIVIIICVESVRLQTL